MLRQLNKDDVRSRVLHAAAKLFLTQGYERATIREIADEAGVNRGSLCYIFKDKESILCSLVNYVIEGQFSATTELLRGKTDDKILLYAAETTLQLYMAESSEQVRGLYNAAYSMPHSADVIFHTITGKLEQIFRETQPTWETKHFYEREIASAGIMRNHIAVPCDMYYTMERKVRTFLETTFLIYHVSDDKIREAIEFVEQFDWAAIAQGVIEEMLRSLQANA